MFSLWRCVLLLSRLKNYPLCPSSLEMAFGKKKIWFSIPGATFEVITVKYKNTQKPEDLIKRADESLYRAKDQGRNRVVSMRLKTRGDESWWNRKTESTG